MNPPPDDPSDRDVPPTRPPLPTEADLDPPGPPGDSERTLDAGRTGPVEPGPGPWTEAQLAPRAPSSGGTSSGGTGQRGVVGKIGPGQTLYTKYRVLRRLGGGAMGDVWLVRHVTLKSEHALKLIVPNIASNGVALMRFQREFEVMASLRHEHAVSIYDACIDDEGGYIDMEYVEGRTIHEVLSDARDRPGRDPAAPLMPLDWIDRVLDQLCDVLQVAHEKGVVHRDLKPANLMLLGGRNPGKEYLKVLDFGIAKIRDDPENVANLGDGALKTAGFIGTPSYGSPEQALNRDDIDGRSDVYSVAVLLYEFATGRLPFRGNQWQIMHMHATEPAPSFAEAAPDLRPLPEVEHVILRALSKDRDRRPQTARDLHDEFHRAVLAIHPSLASLPPSTPSGSWEVAQGVVAAPPPPTEHDSHSTYRPPSEQPATLSAIPAPGARRKPRARPGRDRSDDLGPVVAAGPGRPRIWPWLSAGVVAALLLGAVVIRVNSRAPAPAPGGGPKGPVADGPAPTWEDYLPEGYVAEKGYVDATLWPARIRRTSDGVSFHRSGPGIYLPAGYSAEDEKDLVEGWPRVILRAEDRSGARYLRVKGGTEWTMGAWDAQPSPGRTDTPAHPVVVLGHYVAETEVTNGQFEDFLRKTNRAAPDAWEGVFIALKKEQKEVARKHPAVNLTRPQAQEYAHFASGQLPTEAQWEFDARSEGEQRRYVWGDGDPSRDRARVDKQDDGSTAPVGSFKEDRTRQGASDFNGNVQEWCRDEWEPYRKRDRPLLDPRGVAADRAKAEFVVRGASFVDPTYDCALTRRLNRAGDDIAENVGFRIVIECPDARKPRP